MDLSKEEDIVRNLRELALNYGLELLGASMVLDYDNRLEGPTMQCAFKVTEDAFKAADQIQIDRDFKKIEREITLDDKRIQAEAKLIEMRKEAEARLQQRGKGFLDD